MTRKRALSLGAVLLVLLLAGAFCVGFFQLDYSWGAKQILRDLSVEAELNERGVLTVTENWQIQYRKRERPYWNNAIFLSEDEVGRVSDLTVYDLDYRRYYTFVEGATAFDAGEHGCYINRNGPLVELGWVFPRIDEGVRNFVVSYTLDGVVQHYADADEVRHSFVAAGNTFPVRRFSLRMRFANPGGGFEQLNGWLHSPTGSRVWFEDDTLLYAECEYVPAMNEVELRMLIPPDSVAGSGLLADAEMAEVVRAQEEQYSRENDVTQRYRYLFRLVHLLLALAVAGVVLWLLLRLRRRERAALAGTPTPERELPSCQPPAVVARLVWLAERERTPRSKSDSWALAATVLALAHKRWLRLEPAGEALRLTLCKDGQSPAVGEEIPLLALLRKAAGEGGEISPELLRSWAAAHTGEAHSALAETHAAVAKRFAQQGWLRKRWLVNSEAGWAAVACAVLGLVVLVAGSLPGYWLVGLALLAGAGASAAFSLLRAPLTPKGQAELLRWRGLAAYLREYAVLTERPETETGLWGDYLVYACALGLAKPFTAQLAMVDERLEESGGAPLARYFGGEKPLDTGALWQLSEFSAELAKALFYMRRGGK